MQSACYTLAVFCLVHSGALAADEVPIVRKIDGAESVLAVYPDGWGLGSPARVPAIIFVAWPDGLVVWSHDRIKGGAPYYSGQVEPKKVTALLSEFERDGLFANKKLNDAHFGPDSHFTTLAVRSGKNEVKMQSWHERFEANGKTVASSHGVSGLDGKSRLELLSKEPADYLYFRFVWSETRGKLMDLIPIDGKQVDGSVTTKGGLSWREMPSKR